MKFQDDISNMNTYIHTYIHTNIHTDKPKPICPHFFKVGGIKRRSALKKFEVLFYGDLVYKFKKIMDRTDFSDQFRKIIIRHKRTSYDLNVM